MVIERKTGRLEEVFENPAHREDRGTRIDAGAIHVYLANLAAWDCPSFDERHRMTTCGKVQGCGESANASTNNGDVCVLGHQ